MLIKEVFLVMREFRVLWTGVSVCQKNVSVLHWLEGTRTEKWRDGMTKGTLRDGSWRQLNFMIDSNRGNGGLSIRWIIQVQCCICHPIWQPHFCGRMGEWWLLNFVVDALMLCDDEACVVRLMMNERRI